MGNTDVPKNSGRLPLPKRLEMSLPVDDLTDESIAVAGSLLIERAHR